MFLNRGVLKFSFYVTFVLFSILFLTSFGIAINASLITVNSTLKTVAISDAVNLYAYEINFSYSGSASASSSSYGFLGSGTFYGSTSQNGFLYVYESRLNSTQTGVSGSGNLFNVTHTGELILCSLLAVYANGSSEYIQYSCGSSLGGGQPGGGGGGGGGISSGGGAGATPIATSEIAKRDLLTIPETLTVKTILNRLTTTKITLFNNGTDRIILNLSSQGLSGAISFPTTIELGSGEARDININVLTNERALLTGFLLFSVDGKVIAQLPIVINVRSENFLFDSLLTLADKYRVIRPGGKLIAQINLQQVGERREKVDVVANYIIKDFSGQSYLEESETFFVLGQKEYTKEFATQHLPVGKYVIGLELFYPGAFAVSSAQFEVAPSKSIPFFFVAFLFISLSIVVTIVWFLVSRSRHLLFSSHFLRNKFNKK